MPRALHRLGSALLAGAVVLPACRPAPSPPPSSTPPAAPGGRPGPPAAVPADPAAAYAALRGDGETTLERGRILRHLESDLNTLNPVLQTLVYETYVIRYLFDPLLSFDSSLAIVPALAERWETADGGRTTTLWLRPGVRWHDGQPVRSADVCFTARMALDPAVPAINLRGYLGELLGCEAIDSVTVRLTWKRPYAAALAALTNLFPIPERVYAVTDSRDFARLPANRAPVGSGPWRFVRWDSQARIVVVRNEDYWGEKPRPAETVFKIVDNRETALKACLAGELDEQYVPHHKWAGEVATAAFDDFERVLYYMIQFNQVALDNRSPFFYDRRVRQAMAMAYDSEGISRDLYGGLARRISGPFSPSTKWADPAVEPWPYDLAGAAARLDEAGWKDSDGDGLRDRDGRAFDFELLYPSGNTISEQTGALFQQALGRLGIRMTLRALEGATFFDRVDRGDFTAASLAWSGTPDPESLLVLFDSRLQPPNGVNHYHYANPQVDRLIDEQRSELDHARRVEIVHRIHRILRDDVPTIFALGRPEPRIFRRTIRGIHMSGFGPFNVRPGAEHWWLRAVSGRHSE